MRWNRRVVITSSSLTGAVLLAAAMLMVRPGPLGGHEPSKVWAGHESLSAPILARGGQSLTVLRTAKAVLITPRKVSPGLQHHLARLLGITQLGRKPELWLVSRKSLVRFRSERGIQVVDVRVDAARPGIGSGVVSVIAQDRRRTTRGPWILRQGVYQLSPESAPIHTTLSMGLTRSIQADLHGAGSVVVVGRHGSIQALAATKPGTRWLSTGHPVKLAMLPPLLSMALGSSSVSQALHASAVSLNGISRSWGARSIQHGLKQLGWGRDALARDAATAAALPAPVTTALFSQGSGLSADPANIARSYLPFIDAGRTPPLTLTAESAGRAQKVPGNFAETLAQMPKVTVAGVAFRVWRPYGSYAVVVDVPQHRVAVLEGAAVGDVLPVMQTMAQNRP